MNSSLSTRNRVGLVVAGLLGIIDCFALAMTTPEGEVGPPVGILALSTVCGVVTVVAVVAAWRSASGLAIRLAAGARIVSVLASLPAFFVDVPAGVKIGTAAFVLVSVTAVVLVLTPSGDRAVVLD